MSNVNVRDARSDDADAVARIVDAAYRGYIERIGQPPAPMTCDYAGLIDQGVVRVAMIDSGLGADADAEIVGVLVGWSEADHWYVDNVAVQPGVQGAGVGQALLNDAERAAAAAGRSEIRLYTNAAMTENLGYYPRRGYVETHRGTDSGFSRVYFRKEVSPTGNPAVPSVQADNGVFRVVEWRFAPGAATGFHRHAYDYVVVPMTTGDLEIVNIDGTFRSPLVAGQAYARSAGVEHDVRNPNDSEFVFVEIERLA